MSSAVADQFPPRTHYEHVQGIHGIIETRYSSVHESSLRRQVIREHDLIDRTARRHALRICHPAGDLDKPVSKLARPRRRRPRASGGSPMRIVAMRAIRRVGSQRRPHHRNWRRSTSPQPAPRHPMSGCTIRCTRSSTMKSSSSVMPANVQCDMDCEGASSVTTTMPEEYSTSS